LGRVLSHYADGGWGTQVKEQWEAGKYSDEVAWALADLIAKEKFDPEVEWVTCVPSLRNPTLVRDLAERVAARLRLPFVEAVAKSKETSPQREMSNSAQQYANVERAFVIKGEVPEGPVLLIDDLVDSGWTVTVVTSLLRSHGSGPVHPMLLAQSKAEWQVDDSRDPWAMDREIRESELRLETAEVLSRLESGESFVVTRAGVPVGELRPLRRHRFISADAAVALFRGAPTIDYGSFRHDLDNAAGADLNPWA
jgi:antitoxin (DNA-binding transcriptional repressor) of toxin-antitoxin stability system